MIEQFRTAIDRYISQLRDQLAKLHNDDAYDRLDAKTCAGGTRETIAMSLASWLIIATDPGMGSAYGPESVRLSMISALARQYEAADGQIREMMSAWSDGRPATPALTSTPVIGADPFEPDPTPPLTRPVPGRTAPVHLHTGTGTAIACGATKRPLLSSANPHNITCGSCLVAAIAAHVAPRIGK